ncbi:hypothetical protein K438DRAFT_1957088 [Mycena galopus ATCC 62051]|nr:hypothetical protein K438DRAFT_1957088 [Mycena galopus ATCC 62051]
MGTQTRHGVATIFSLPNELLAAITLAGQEVRVADLHTGSGSQWQTRSETFKSEWTLSHVSHHFRDVIVGAPALWTLVEADLGKIGSAEILKLYLERSRTYTISAILLEGENTPSIEKTALERIILEVHRIRTLKIVLREWGVEMLNPFCDVAAPHLEHLELVDAASHMGPMSVAMFSSGAPRLTFLKINGLDLELGETPWTASLTHLEFYRYPGRIETLVALTAQSPMLVHLYLDAEGVVGQWERFHIPTLKSLHLWISEEHQSGYLVTLLDFFDTPALTGLVVEGTHGAQICALLNSTSLPHSSFPALTSLSFVSEGSCTCESDLDSLPHLPPPFAPFPALNKLTLIHQCFTSTLFQGLLEPTSKPWPLLELTICPKLGMFEGTRGALEVAANSKRERGEPLPKVKLFHSRAVWENWDERRSGDVEIF